MPATSPSVDRHAAEDANPVRRGQLALALQEVFTATVRLRANRQVATDADAFRAHVKQLLGTADREARRIGYASDDVALALYAIVVYLDESVLNSAQPMFAGWPSRPLKEEIFGGHMGGEIFFQHLRDLLTRQDSDDLADLLEVYQLCLLLGYQGRYSTSEKSELRGLSSAIAEKIQRTRGSFGELSPQWAAPHGESLPKASDPWLTPLAAGAMICCLVAALLFGVFRSSLSGRARDVREASAAVVR